MLAAITAVTSLTLALDWPAPMAEDSFANACLVSTEGWSVSLVLEIAATPEARSRGLMHRKYLSEEHGMLFIFPEARPGDAGFWMYNTLIPLDIAFLDDEGLILRLLTMQPCKNRDPRQCRVYTPGVSYSSALETNAGFFAKRDLRPGDRLLRRQSCPSSNSSVDHENSG